MRFDKPVRVTLGVAFVLVAGLAIRGDDTPDTLPIATIDGNGPGWRVLEESDFTDVNGEPDTWTWKDGVIHGTGLPVGVIRSAKPYTNFELVAQWRHLKAGGNSEIFVWASPEA